MGKAEENKRLKRVAILDAALQLFTEDEYMLSDMCENIKRNKEMGIYDGAYEVVKQE